MFLSTRTGFYTAGLLLSLALLTACDSKKEDPASLPGHWNLQSQHISNVDATSGQTQVDYHLPGTSGDYLEITDTKFEEYTASQLAFTAPYTRTGNTVTMTGTLPRVDYSREITELTSKKLVLKYKLPYIVANQAVHIEATYSR